MITSMLYPRNLCYYLDTRIGDNSTRYILQFRTAEETRALPSFFQVFRPACTNVIPNNFDN